MWNVQVICSPAVIVTAISAPVRRPGSAPLQLAEASSQPTGRTSRAKCAPGATVNVCCSPSRRFAPPALVLKAKGVPSAGEACLAIVKVVITGGGADLKNMADYMQGVLGRNVRVGRPRGLPGLPEAMQGPGFSTLVGLARLASANSGDLRDLALGALQDQHKGGLLARLVRALKQGT